VCESFVGEVSSIGVVCVGSVADVGFLGEMSSIGAMCVGLI
jgi:hypothetical protein